MRTQRASFGRTPFAAAMGALLFACASPVQIYPGEPRPTEEVVTVSSKRGRIIRADGGRLHALKIAMLPGTIEVVGRFRLRGEEIAPNVREEDEIFIACRFVFEGRAGHHYVVGAGRPIAGRDRGVVARYHYMGALYDKSEPDSVIRAKGCGRG